jgi:hypothetical protein
MYSTTAPRVLHTVAYEKCIELIELRGKPVMHFFDAAPQAQNPALF